MGQGNLVPVRHTASILLADLQEIEDQKDKIQRNTEQFVKGLPANNVLLTGARGTGKSSLIKACLNEYAPRGLRLIEIDKDDIIDLPDIVELVSSRPEKFMVFCDDLSFEDGESGLMSAFTAGCHVIDVTFMDHYPSCEGLRTAKAAAAMRRSWLQDSKPQPPPMSG
jgi:predicted AAA+ superfamily ATPase